jgi:hypothetical protein
MEVFGEAPVFIETYDVTDIDLAKEKEMTTYKSTFVYAKDPSIYNRSAMTWDDVELVSLTSDGAKSFLKSVAGDFKSVDFLDIMAEFHAFKNKNGVFVQRRMKAMTKSHKKVEITHYDDISVAAIITG